MREKLMIEEYKIPPFLRQIVVIAVIFIAIIGLKYSAPILSLILLSMFIAVIIYPFLMWLRRRGLSYNLSVSVTLVGIALLGVAIVGFLVVTLAQLIKAIPSMTINSSGVLAQYGNQIIQFLVAHIPETNSGGLIAAGTFIVFAVIFLVYELPQIKIRLEKGLGADNPTLNKTYGLMGAFVEYFVIRAKVNFFYGIGVSSVLVLFDINFALLWGFLTFFLGFIPYIGIIIAAIPAVLVAWAKYGIQGAIVMALFFIIINTIAESIIFPKLTGKGLQMSVYVVFVSLFVWGWILGPIGFFIGVPMTLVIIKYLENFEETKWLALLMGSNVEDNTKENKSKDYELKK
jgi:AI-2 transport protein TqsA